MSAKQNKRKLIQREESCADERREKNMRKMLLEELEKYKSDEEDPNALWSTIRNDIDNYRIAYRKEMKKK